MLVQTHPMLLHQRKLAGVGMQVEAIQYRLRGCSENSRLGYNAVLILGYHTHGRDPLAELVLECDRVHSGQNYGCHWWPADAGQPAYGRCHRRQRGDFRSGLGVLSGRGGDILTTPQRVVPIAPRMPPVLVRAQGSPKALTALSQRILRIRPGSISGQLSARSTDPGKRVSGCG
jgi:hypothetical protein